LRGCSRDRRQFIARSWIFAPTSNAGADVVLLRGFSVTYDLVTGQGRSGVIASQPIGSLAPLPRALRPLRQAAAQLLTAELPAPPAASMPWALCAGSGCAQHEVAAALSRDIVWRSGNRYATHTQCRVARMFFPCWHSTAARWPLPARTIAQDQQPTPPSRARCRRTINPSALMPCGAVILAAFGCIVSPRRSQALRHTLAFQLLDQGVDQGCRLDVLAPPFLSTPTLIYAKLDHPRLAAVAVPWPGFHMSAPTLMARAQTMPSCPNVAAWLPSAYPGYANQLRSILGIVGASRD